MDFILLEAEDKIYRAMCVSILCFTRSLQKVGINPTMFMRMLAKKVKCLILVSLCVELFFVPNVYIFKD